MREEAVARGVRGLLAFFVILLLAPTALAQSTLSVANYTFTPSRLVVAPGATVTVTNGDTEPHAMKTTDGKTMLLASVDAKSSASFTAPTTPGTYLYYCPFHTSADSTNFTYMRGALVVESPSASPSTSPGASPSPKSPGFEAMVLVGAAIVAVLVARRR